MGNTLEQHRATIGGNAARQLSRGWAPSIGVFKPSATTDESRKKPQGRAKATAIFVTEVILLSIMFSLLTMACPLVQQLFGYVLCDHGSFQTAGAVDSKVLVLGPCWNSGMQELLEGCWFHQSTERGTSSYFSANFKPTMPGTTRTTMIRMHVEDIEPDLEGLQVTFKIQIL